MSSLKNASKAKQVHRERGQLASRSHFGLLEKKKDYKQRAVDYQRKQNTLKVLKKKALDRNPDEFYFKMVRTRLEEGVHQTEDTTPKYTDAQLKLIQSQDMRYVTYKRSLELKKIEKLQGSLHLLTAGGVPQNKHTVFVDKQKDVESFDAAEYFDTPPSLLHHAYNRPRLDTLRKHPLPGSFDKQALEEIAEEKKKKYKVLQKRIEREKELKIVSQKMQARKLQMDKKARKKKVKEETINSAAIYKMVPCRKR